MIWAIDTRSRQRLSLLLFILSGLIYLALLVESICAILGVYILTGRNNSWLYNLFCEAGIVFREKPILVPISFIIFFIAYIVLGISMYYNNVRNRMLSTLALGFLTFSIVIIIYAFWELILKYPFVVLVFFITIGCVILAYFLAPWREWACERLYTHLDQIGNTVYKYRQVIDSLKSRDYDNLAVSKLNNIIENYVNELNNIKSKLSSDNEDLKLLELDIYRLRKAVNEFRDLSTGQSAIKLVKDEIFDELRKYFADNRLVAVSLFELPEEYIRKFLFKLSKQKSPFKFSNKEEEMYE